jgi:hypothetical protein
MEQKEFSSHNQLKLEVVRTLEYGRERRLWLLRCQDCGQHYLKSYQQLNDWAEGEGKVQVQYRPIAPDQLRKIELSLKQAWKLADSRPYILWDEKGQLHWLE